MLTVIREMAERGRQAPGAMAARAARRPRRATTEQDALLAEMLATALFAGEEAVAPDARAARGARRGRRRRRRRLGLVVIVARARRRARRRGGPSCPRSRTTRRRRLDQVHHADSRFRYCTNFIVTGDGLDGGRSSPRSRSSATRSWSSATRRRSRSTSTPTTPSAAKALFDRRRRGQPRVDIADMREQVAERAARLGGGARSGVVAVASGDGMRSSSRTSAPRRRRRPDAEPLDRRPARGDRGCAAEEVLVLPNSPNVVMAAEEAAGLSPKRPAGGRRRLRLPAGRRWRRWSSSTPTRARRERRAARRGAGGDPRSARSRRRRATTPRGASSAATPSASSTTRSSPGAAPARRWPRRSRGSPRAPRSSP